MLWRAPALEGGRVASSWSPGHGLVATLTCTGAGSEAKKTGCAPKIDLQIRAPLIDFIFFPGRNFLMWMGGSLAAAHAAILPLPHPVTVSRGLSWTLVRK